MNILQLISTKGFFGAENVVVNLSRGLKDMGFNVYIGIFCDLRKASNLTIIEEIKKYNIPFLIFDCRKKFDFNNLLKLRKFIKEKNIDIVHSHNYKSNIYSFFATLFLKCKKVATCHLWAGESFKMKFYEFLDKLFLKKFDKVVGVSEKIISELIKSSIPKEKIEFVSNGIDIEKFTPEKIDKTKVTQIKKELGIKDNEKVVGTIGRLSKQKGHIYLIYAAKEIIKEFPNVKFLIVGDGELKEELLLEVKKLNLEEKIIFTGFRNDIPEILNVIDIFVLPSLNEGMPMVLLEAMAAKKPIIATNVGAIPKLIENNKTGFLIELKSEKKIYECIITLLKDSKKSLLFTQNTYGKVKNEYSLEYMTEKYLNIYKQLFINDII